MKRRLLVGALVACAFSLAAYAAASCQAEVPAVPPGMQPDSAVVTDAPQESGVDAFRPAGDGSVDAGEVEGSWGPIRGMPDTCKATIAEDAAASMKPFPWRDCIGVPACRAFVADWGEPNQSQFVQQRIEPTFEANGKPYVSYARKYSLNGLRYLVVQELEGRAVMAIHEGPDCTFNLQASISGIGLVAASGTASFVGGASELAAAGIVMAEATTVPGALLQGVNRGPNFLAFEARTGTALTTAAYDLVSRRVVAASVGHTAQLELPMSTGEGYFALAATSPSTIVFAALAGGHTTVVRPEVGRYVTAYAMDRARANALVWSEAQVDGSEIFWTSPVSTTEGGIQRRPVARGRFRVRYIVNNGFLVAVDPGNVARVIRLSDGLGWTLPQVEDFTYLVPIWIDENYVWVQASKPLPPATAAMFRAAIRIGRSSLGPPTVAPGL